MNAPAAASVLVVDDEPDLRTLYELTLLREGYDVTSAPDLAVAREALAGQRFDVLITDMRLPDGLGLELLRELGAGQRGEKSIVITAYGSAENAVEALKSGAFDYLTKPVDLKQLRAAVSAALQSRPSARAMPAPAATAGGKPRPAQPVANGAPALQRIVGQSACMVQIRSRIEKVATSMAPVLILGESGTGKELVARAVHDCSHRASGPFVAVNCGAIPENLIEAEFFGARKGAYTGASTDREGYFQAAQGGTLFLDEIGDLPLAMQAKLLRVIQERRVRPLGGVQEEAVDVRLVSATHRDLSALVQGGVTLRFSLPDDSEGKGITGKFVLYVNGDSVKTFTVSSYWAWQYILKSGSKYPDNIPNVETKFPRMRFDEMHFKLENEIPENATLRLVKADDNDIPYVIDFVELEKIKGALTYDSIPDENKVLYLPENGPLQSFIAQNGGKTIFLPEGKYEVDSRIIISGNGTKIIGAGMWHTEIYFPASSDSKSTYNKRGIETSSSNIILEGFYMNTVNNKRYYNNDPIYQVGKGLMGSFGLNSSIKNLWIEHFECGGWIEGAVNLNMQHCRYRNNYADGMNLAYGCKNSVVEHCSYRNNGDDDMASWSRGDKMCENNTYSFSTSENNWRASSLGFFGGKQNKAYNIVIIDPMEAGFRVTCDFPGMPFSNDGYSEFYNISVYKGGVASGTAGISGDLWGNQQGALHINSSSQYDLVNIKIYNIDFYDSRNDAIFIGSGSRTIKNLFLKDISIHRTGRYGIYYNNPKGSGAYCNILYNNIGASSNTNTKPTAFSFDEDCNFSAIFQNKKLPEVLMFSKDRTLFISGLQNQNITIYDMLGKTIYQALILADPEAVYKLNTGFYIVRWDKNQTLKIYIN